MKNPIFAIFFGLMVIGCGPTQVGTYSEDDSGKILNFSGQLNEDTEIFIPLSICPDRGLPIVVAQTSDATGYPNYRNYIPAEMIFYKLEPGRGACSVEIFGLDPFSYFWVSVIIP